MIDPSDVQVVGLCRFSYPSTGGFKKFHSSLEERRAALYAPRRLNLRFLWFEHVFIPSIMAQTDRDFRMCLLLGEDLPEPWRSRMESIIASAPFLVPFWRAPTDHRTACRDVLQSVRDRSKRAVAEFRLDDDDAVAVDYVADLKWNYRRMARLGGKTGRIALDHGKGIVMQGNRDGSVATYPLLTHCWSAGLAVYLRPDDDATIMDFPHHRIWQRMPFVSLTNRLAFVRGDHGTNDAKTPFEGAEAASVPEEDLLDLMKARFNIDLDGFERAWAALAKDS